MWGFSVQAQDDATTPPPPSGPNRLVEGIVRGGISFSNVWLRFPVEGAKLPTKNNLMIGFHAGGGALVGVPGVPWLRFETGVYFDMRGGKYKTYFPDRVNRLGDNPPTLQEFVEWGHEPDNIQLEVFTVTMPIHVVVALEMFRSGIFLSAGPVVSYGMKGTVSYIPYNNIGTATHSAFKPEGGLSHWDVGVGVRMGLRMLGIELSGYYDVGLLNVGGDLGAKYDPSLKGGTKGRYGVGGISVGYLF